MTLAHTTTQDKSQFVYNASYGGATDLAPLYGTLQRLGGQLVFLSDAGELLFPTPDEWYQFGMVYGEVGLSGTQTLIDACRARAERALLERSNRLEVAA